MRSHNHLIVDMHGLLFRSENASRKKAKRFVENDYYDSDEDTYFDRTGQIENKREVRRLRALVSLLRPVILGFYLCLKSILQGLFFL